MSGKGTLPQYATVKKTKTALRPQLQRPAARDAHASGCVCSGREAHPAIVDVAERPDSAVSAAVVEGAPSNLKGPNAKRVSIRQDERVSKLLANFADSLVPQCTVV